MLDNAHVTVTIPADELGYALSAIRMMLKRRERDRLHANPDRINGNEHRVKKLRAAEATLNAALDEHLAQAETGAVRSPTCPSCKRDFPNGGTCRMGGCPMGGDF